MLQPTNRLTLIDAMRPPAGFVFDEAMAVTFTLDLRALLAAPAAFVLSRAVDVDDDRGAQPEAIELIHAIRASAGRISVFNQAGEIALPPSRRVFAFLEGSVVAVTAPRGGVVHPKVWVLRYVDPEDQQRPQLRVLSASRNLTFDSSWDTVLRLDTTDDDQTAGVELHPIADLFDALSRRSIGTLTEAHQRRVASLGADLRARRFALPAGVDDLAVHVLGLRAGQPPFPGHTDRSLVVAPFTSDDFLTRIVPNGIDELVSQGPQLDQLSAEAIDQVGEMYVFDDGSAVDTRDDDGLAVSDPARPLRGLHAKIFAFETGGQAQLFCGSANATGAAFNANVEVLFELIGPVERLGVDAICGGTDDEVGLRALFFPHRPTPESDLEADEPLAAARRAIGRLEITGEVEASGSGWAVTYRASAPLPLERDVTVECWPLPSPGNRRPVAGGAPLSVRFETSLEGISGFLVFQLSDADGVQTSCVVPVHLEGLPPDRDRQLLRGLVGSADRFLRYLLALLADGHDDLSLTDMVDEATKDRPDSVDRASGAGLPVLEHLVRTLRRNPTRLLSIDPLVTDLAEDDALPDGFALLWQQLREVAGHRSAP